MFIKNPWEEHKMDTHKMNTKAADQYLNKFFDDSRFLERDKDYDTLPQISNNIDENFCQTFLQKYISFCQSITSERRDKLKQMLDSKEYNIKSCENTIYSRIKSMIDDCDKQLSLEDKTILEWNTDYYSSVPDEKGETVKKWLAETDYRNPSRLYLYKIAFALNLTAYFPNEMNEDNENYKTSMNFLFNKVYNQRYITRTADELIFVFCLKNGKNYLTAMKMLAKYKRICKDIDFSDEVNLQTKSNDTILFLQNNITKNEKGFIEDLIRLTPLLEDKYSSVFKLIEKFIEFFSGDSKIITFEEKHKDEDREKLCSMDISPNVTENTDKRSGKVYLNLGAKVLISETLKRNLLFLNNRMIISSAFNRKLTPDQNEYLQRTFSELGLSESLYQTIKDSAKLSISAVIGKYSQDYLSAILDDLIITMNDVYNSGIIHRKIKKDGGYEYNLVKNPKGISHNLIYRNMRNALITAHFFHYWSDMNAKQSVKDYIDEINQILANNYYLPMYSKNNFDCFFILCTKLYPSKNINPIDVYYKFFDYIYSIYHDYNEFFLSSREFKNYKSLSSCELLVEPEDTYANILSYRDKNIKKCFHKIDDPDVQKGILKAIHEI